MPLRPGVCHTPAYIKDHFTMSKRHPTYPARCQFCGKAREQHNQKGQCPLPADSSGFIFFSGRQSWRPSRNFLRR